MGSSLKWSLVSALALAAATLAARAEPVTDEMLLKDATTPTSVLTNGIGLQGQRFSPLKQIDKTNVKTLVPAWSFSFGGEKQRGQEGQALVHDGVVYITASYSRIFAVDAKSGEKIWEYDARLPEGILPCCDVVNRGAAIYGDLVYFGTLDAQLVALNAKNGRPICVDEGRPGDPARATEGKEGKEVYSVPSFLGDKNQMPMAYSQNTGLFYVPSNEWGMDIHNEPIACKKGAAYLGAGFTIHTVFDDHIGSLKAIDPADGSIKWEYKNRAPLWGGVLTTAGGLVITGTPEGYLKVFDDKTGEELYKFNVGAGIVAPPIAWEQDGQEMIGVAAGWGGAVPLWGGDVAKMVKDIDQGGSYWVFRLPQKSASN